MSVIYDDRPVKQMVYPAILFLIISMAIGVFLAFNAFVFPDFFNSEYIQFGRLRPVHVNGVTLLWLLSAGVGLFYYFVPRLCGVKLWSYPLACVTTTIWWFALVVGTFSFPFGTNWGWEYAELPMWIGFLPIKALFTISWVLLSINLFMTIAQRRYKKMYVSLWYTMGCLIWTTATYVFGNFGLMFLPGGISRVNMSFFYIHNLVGLIFTPMGVAAAYYFIPKIAKTPLYSHRLSMIGFWTIAFVYAWVGAHHIIHGPTSQWLQTTSIVFSMLLFIPVFTVITNFFLTLKGNWNAYVQKPAIRFLMVGTLYYLLVCIQGPLQSLRNVNEVTSKTDWIISHAHMALYGTFTFFALGGLYHVIPSITKKRLWSEPMANWHFSLNLIGSLPFLLALMVGGFFQGLMWASWADGCTYAQYHANITECSFLDTIGTMWWWWLSRALSGGLILFANVIFAINAYNTIVLKEKKP